MSDQRVGAALRAVRIRRGLRQKDVASKAGVSRSQVSLVERGHIAQATIESLRTISAVLDVRIDVIARWRGGDLDRVLSAGHATLQNSVAAYLVDRGWQVFPEVSFAYYAERGSIDLLAWHPATLTLLIVEIKTELVDISDLLHVADRKLRLAPRVARDRGLRPAAFASWLVVADTSVNRRRAALHRELLRAVFPAGTVEMRRWCAQPSGQVAGLSFWAISNPDGANRKLTSPKRVRPPKRPPNERGRA